MKLQTTFPSLVVLGVSRTCCCFASKEKVSWSLSAWFWMKFFVVNKNVSLRPFSFFFFFFLGGGKGRVERMLSRSFFGTLKQLGVHLLVCFQVF